MAAATVFTLLVTVGRRPGDGLPEGASRATLLCYAAAVDEAEAVHETVAVLKRAGLAPLEATGHGSLEERLAGEGIAAEEQGLIERARAENAVIVAEVTPAFPAARGVSRTDRARSRG